MLLQRRRKPIAFGGPSLSLARKRYESDFEYRAPIRRGDLHALIEHTDYRPGCALITDGLFGESMAVTPAECMDLINTGWLLFGASSMGALRAADCCNVGMVGIGRIFFGYRTGYYHSDADVAVLYDFTTHVEVSVSFVHVDYLARQIALEYPISGLEHRKLLCEIRNIPWFKRSPETVADVFSRIFGHPNVADTFMLRWQDPKFNPKVLDGLAACELLVGYYLKKTYIAFT